MSHSDSVRSIRNRLFMLLLRAFVIVVAFLILFTLLATGLVLAYPSQTNPLYRLPTISRLETYYLARGSWDGVSTIFNNSLPIEASQWQSSILLDAHDRVVVDHGRPVGQGMMMMPYKPLAGEAVTSIVVNGELVGKLVLEPGMQRSERRFTFNFLMPLVLLSLILAVFATLIGLLLTRRVVSPLAEVIVAAEEIAGGNLQTRVRVQAPDDLRDLSGSFNKMAEALERNDHERRDMLADIAHELRTPLTVLRGRLEGIMDGVYPADESNIGPVLEETYLLERLVEDLRLLTLAESHQLLFEKKEVDLVEIARRALNMFQAEADEKKIALDLETGLEKALVLADSQRTEQVVGNLLANALRYVPDGGRVWVQIDQANDEFVLCVNDNGPGVLDSDLPYIFNRFWRGERSRSRASGGAGLGLAIAKLLIVEQEGKVDAANLPAGGLQVRITMKVAGG
jgi:signal transduction histidine kinase